MIEISGRKIGDGYDPIVIVEIGINHEGSLKTAIEMVDAACNAGAEIIKHQTHVVDDEMSKDARSVIPGNTDASIYDVMERCSLSEADEITLKKYVEEKGMIFLSTPFSRAADHENLLHFAQVSLLPPPSSELLHFAQVSLLPPPSCLPLFCLLFSTPLQW